MALQVNAQQQTGSVTPPGPVKKEFRKRYPGTEKVTWEKEGENYEAVFESGQKEQSVLFNASGKVLQTESVINAEELPAKIQEYLISNYMQAPVEAAVKITDAAGVVTYEVIIHQAELLFDANGTPLRQEEEAPVNE